MSRGQNPCGYYFSAAQGVFMDNFYYCVRLSTAWLFLLPIAVIAALGLFAAHSVAALLCCAMQFFRYPMRLSLR